MDYGPVERANLTMDFPLRNIPICILDFDGVLHHHEVYYMRGVGVHMREPGHKLFEWSGILTELLTPHPHVRLVLSTAWVRGKGFEFAKASLPEALRSRVIGSTFHNREIQKLEFDFLSRGQQVLNYVERRQLERWFAIDDDYIGFPDWCQHRLVKTQPQLGVNEPSVQRKISSILAAL